MGGCCTRDDRPEELEGVVNNRKAMKNPAGTVVRHALAERLERRANKLPWLLYARSSGAWSCGNFQGKTAVEKPWLLGTLGSSPSSSLSRDTVLGDTSCRVSFPGRPMVLLRSIQVERRVRPPSDGVERRTFYVRKRSQTLDRVRSQGRTGDAILHANFCLRLRRRWGVHHNLIRVPLGGDSHGVVRSLRALRLICHVLLSLDIWSK